MIAIGCDQAGFELKQAVMAHLQEKGIEFKDFGSFGGESVDYPLYGEKVAREIAEKRAEYGIVICGTGIGISIAANKVKGIRCALCSDSYSARMTRAHNDANMLAMGGRVIGPMLALDIVDAFLGAEFEGGRHQRRVNQITEIENK
ncbi:MAG: ribose 5-phosphate isomerase B [Christensenellaceae bacterium]|jgi:ribose 5-phosphate isomerase B|nr:ribose 5-phosphate isomerase B [Christensenellaceae bacterium]